MRARKRLSFVKMHPIAEFIPMPIGHVLTHFLLVVKLSQLIRLSLSLDSHEVRAF